MRSGASGKPSFWPPGVGYVLSRARPYSIKKNLKIPQKWPKKGLKSLFFAQKCPKMAKNHQKWAKTTKNSTKTTKNSEKLPKIAQKLPKIAKNYQKSRIIPLICEKSPKNSQKTLKNRPKNSEKH